MDSSPSSGSSGQTSQIELAPGVFVRDDDLRLQYARSSGPGGQNVNKLNTKAELWVAISDIQGLEQAALKRLVTLAGKRITRQGLLHLSAQTERTQERNRQAVIDRLRLLIEKAK